MNNVMNYMENYKKRERYFVPIYITQDMKNIAYSFAKRVAEEKMKEEEYIKDGDKLAKRYVTGIIGEMAVLKLLGIDYKKVNIEVGKTRFFQFADLAEFGFDSVGVKTVEYGKAPVVFKTNRDDQIIVVIKGNYAIVCGIASARVLNTYSSINLILDPKLKEKGNKVGFYGFDHLFTIRSKNDLNGFLNYTRKKGA